MPRRALLALLAPAALLPAAPASAAPAVVSTGYAVHDASTRSATGFCVATGVEVVAVAFTECGFAGEDSPHTALSAGPAAVATFTGPMGEQPKWLCWKGYAVTVTGAPVPFEGCTIVS